METAGELTRTVNQKPVFVTIQKVIDGVKPADPAAGRHGVFECVYAYLKIAGNAYIGTVNPRNDATPVDLYVLLPDQWTARS
jgi:hypothetical protein